MAAGIELKHSCGVFGIWKHQDAARYAYLGLYSQQHRGQESCGISSTDGKTMFTRKGMGLVAQYFTEERIDYLQGDSAIGHVRYSTAGSSVAPNAQPIYFDTHRGPIALAHNGNLVNADTIRKDLGKAGTIFMTSSDSEIVLHLIAQSEKNDLEEAIFDALKQVEGAYSFTILTPKMLIAVRDPHGFRPLVLGKLDDSYVFASETSAFDLIGAQFIRELEPGEAAIVNESGIRFERPLPAAETCQCIFEHVYFARPDSFIFNALVHSVRTRIGEILAKETRGKLDVDLVMPIPDGGTYIAQGYAKESGIPFEMGLVRNHYVGRTFIEPEQGIRDFGVKVKLNPIRQLIEGKKVALVDDSIVRGTTSRKIVEMIRGAGATEVHYVIGSPPYVSPCYYGIDTPSKDQLIANKFPLDEIAKQVGADSVSYISLKGLLESVAPDSDKFCTSCFTGKYPVGTSLDTFVEFRKWRRRKLNDAK